MCIRDSHRGIRQGASEIIYGAGKSPVQIDKIARTLWNSGQKTILITRMKKEAADFMGEDLPFTYFEEAKVGLVGEKLPPRHNGYILVATGGTSDIPVAEEAALTAEIMGNHVERLYDVGVAGIHRLLSHIDKIMGARVIIAIAGMEGALASVIGGLADCPVTVSYTHLDVYKRQIYDYFFSVFDSISFFGRKLYFFSGKLSGGISAGRLFSADRR